MVLLGFVVLIAFCCPVVADVFAWTGTPGDDVKSTTGTVNDDTITQDGLAGNDMLYAVGVDGNDQIVQNGGDGNDSMGAEGGRGNDQVTVNGSNGNDEAELDGGNGNDQLVFTGGPGNDQAEISGGDGDDVLQVDLGEGDNQAEVVGGQGNDAIVCNLSSSIDEINVDSSNGGYDTLVVNRTDEDVQLLYNGNVIFTTGNPGTILNTTGLTSATVVNSTGDTEFQWYRPPVVTAASPKSGYRGTKVKVRISGDFFRAGARANLTKGAAILKMTTMSVTVPSRIVAKVKIPAKAKVGKWNLVVSNPDGGNATKVKAFTVK